ncbi:MAG: hypothetical protein AAB627_00170 [Patescibacteria group bacterium]
MMNIKTSLILIIVAAGIGAAFLLLREIREPGPAGDSAGFIVGKNAIYVAEQAPSKTVSVAVVQFEKPGFVVIHEEANEKPGKILGASVLLSKGETKNVLVRLSRMTADGETLYAMLHLDDGDRVFEPGKDYPAEDSLGGGPVMTIFTVDRDATEPGDVKP